MRLPLAACEACAARRGRARVWLWLAHWAGVEEDAILYHRDVTLRHRKADELDMLASARRRFIAKADEVGGPGYADRAWRDALEDFCTIDAARAMSDTR